jgi:hypothetical protein
LQKALSPEFCAGLKDAPNPYQGDGQTSARIVEQLTTVDLANLVVKEFYDLPGLIVP